jgi:DNA-directed RNA polymerase alpha subunit/DNA-directed RNA polymerase subunit L
MSGKIVIELDKKSNATELQFDIKGDTENGLDKSIVNSLRRTLLSTIPTVAFRTESDNSDIVIKKNNGALHNEFLADRIGLIPLYINPSDYHKQYLFHLNVANNPSEPITTITANDFDIYPLKKSIDPSLLESISFNDYDKEQKLSQKEKDLIFKPFKFNGKNNYCIITELKTSNSSTLQEIEIYGTPSVSYAYENAKWQAVTRATYSFKRDEKLFEKILQDKVKVEEIAKSNQAKFKKELFIAESERYFHRDKNLKPFWFTFNIDSVHFMKSKELFITANQLLIDNLEKLMDEFPKMVSQEKSFLTLEQKEEGIFKIIINGFDDTIGDVLQNYIANKMIDKSSILSICGYKKTHPLEDTIFFIISLNKNNKIFQLNKPQQVVAIIEQMNEACNGLIQIYSLIIKEAEQKL